ncbi:MAG: 50S ribosomal protein L18 [Verrucomicrobiia bacterium]
MPVFNRRKKRVRLHERIRKTVKGTADRPRLSVHFSGRHIYGQLIDDVAGRTIAAVSTQEAEFRGGVAKANKATAERLGALLAERGLAKRVEMVVFDRGGFKYHGKVAALADAARAKGLKF